MDTSDSEKNRRILVIDDNRAIHQDFCKILAASATTTALDDEESELFGAPTSTRKRIHFDLDSAFQGQGGVRLAAQARLAGKPYAVAFVDIRMPPGMDGVETTTKLWEIDPDLQVVICSAYSDYSWDEMLEKCGYSDRMVILKKPFDAMEVLQLAQALTEKWRLTRDTRANVNDLEERVRERTSELESANRELQAEIVERKTIQEQFLQSQKMEAVGRLAGGVAHDFNNMLTAISGYSELMLRRLPDENPLRADALQIEKAAYRAARLTRQLLAFSRKQMLQPKVLDLNAVIMDISKMLQRLIGENIKLCPVPAEALGRVKADPGQIEQVIMNLAINARDAMQQGGTLTIETENVTVDARRPNREVTPGEYVMLAVSDTGIGMTDDVKAHLFEPFFTTKPKDKGTGLGLATCYGIIKQSGGHITVTTAPGKGTTFTMYLPRVQEGIQTEARQEESSGLPRGKETILLVEDEPALLELAGVILGEQGYTVLPAVDGEEGLRIADQRDGEGVDLVMTDVVMPKMGGKELVDHIRRKHPNAKVLFASGYTEDAIAHHGVLEPGISFLQKPYTPTTLARKVREVLDQPSAPKPETAQKTFGFTKISHEVKTTAN